MMPRGTQVVWLAALLAPTLAVGLTSCAGAPGPPIADFGAATPNPIQISRTRLVHAVGFPSQGASVTAPELSALYGFLAGHGVGPSDTLIIERGSGTLDLARAEALQANLQTAGLHPAMVTDAALGAGVARVVVERYVAIPPDCPNWSAAPAPNFQNYDQRNFGCADSRNLAAMVADPKDLAMGASALAPQVGPPVTRPVLTYRTGPGAAGMGGGAAAAGGQAPSGAGSSGAGPGSAGGAPGPTGPS
jgi:pilus biogenesis lipoprotein CpaD